MTLTYRFGRDLEQYRTLMEDARQLDEQSLEYKQRSGDKWREADRVGREFVSRLVRAGYLSSEVRTCALRSPTGLLLLLRAGTTEDCVSSLTPLNVIDCTLEGE